MSAEPKHIMYEWVVEATTSDEYEDIEDLHFWDTVDQCLRVMREPAPDGFHWCWALVRNRYNREDNSDLEDRQYCYVVNGELEEVFSDGAKVPQRFRAELAKALKNNS